MLAWQWRHIKTFMAASVPRPHLFVMTERFIVCFLGFAGLRSSIIRFLNHTNTIDPKLRWTSGKLNEWAAILYPRGLFARFTITGASNTCKINGYCPPPKKGHKAWIVHSRSDLCPDGNILSREQQATSHGLVTHPLQVRFIIWTCCQFFILFILTG